MLAIKAALEEHSRANRRGLGCGRRVSPVIGGSSSPFSGRIKNNHCAIGMALRYLVAVLLLVVVLGSSAAAQSFARRETRQHFNQVKRILAVVDLNRDGRDDLIVGGQPNDGSESAPDRLAKLPVRVVLGTRGGHFRLAPAAMVPRSIRARTPVVVTDDFNGDGWVDFAVFDAGVYVWEHSSGYGNPPQLYVSSPNGRRYRRSAALATAVRREHRRRPPPVATSNLADLHIKSATSGDIDGDEDIDLWVQSGGGANVEEHFLVNNGDGTFTVDRDNRATRAVLHNQPPDGSQYWGWDGGHFVDVDNDGDLDLALGQIRDRGPLVFHQRNTVLVNDGTGYFRNRIDLPPARFFGGFTAVPWLTHFDVNDDGVRGPAADAHPQRRRQPQRPRLHGPLHPGSRQHRRRQLRGRDPTWIRRQRGTAIPGQNYGGLAMHDVDLDGCQDLVVTAPVDRIRPRSPLVYRNNGSGQFSPVPPTAFRPGPGRALRLGGDAHRRERRRGDRLRRFGTRSRTGRHLGNQGRRDVAGDPVEHDTPPATPVVPVNCCNKSRESVVEDGQSPTPGAKPGLGSRCAGQSELSAARSSRSQSRRRGAKPMASTPTSRRPRRRVPPS